jgi:hypothetical protein
MTEMPPVQERYPRFSWPNPQCTWFNRPGEGNMAPRSWTGMHKHLERLRSIACDRECSEQEGTLMARRKLTEETVIRLLQCRRWTCLASRGMRPSREHMFRVGRDEALDDGRGLQTS